ASAPPSPDPPSAERLSFHLRVIAGKIVEDCTLGMFDVPDAANGGDAMRARAPQHGDVLRSDAADRHDRYAAVPHELLEERRTSFILVLGRGAIVASFRRKGEDVAHHAPRRAGEPRGDSLLERVHARAHGAGWRLSGRAALQQDLHRVGYLEGIP